MLQKTSATKNLVIASIVAALAMSVSPAVMAAHLQCSKIPAVKKLPYYKGRAKLIAAGWQPTTILSKEDIENNIIEATGDGAELWKHGYHEVYYCAPSGLEPCSFYFKNEAGQYLDVDTTGENDGEDKPDMPITSVQCVAKPQD